jgi:hypothetical protein
MLHKAAGNTIHPLGSADGLRNRQAASKRHGTEKDPYFTRCSPVETQTGHEAPQCRSIEKRQRRAHGGQQVADPIMPAQEHALAGRGVAIRFRPRMGLRHGKYRGTLGARDHKRRARGDPRPESTSFWDARIIASTVSGL